MTGPKSNGTILKIFLIYKKIPCITRLLDDYKFITNFKEKAEIFLQFFCKKMFSYKHKQ